MKKVAFCLMCVLTVFISCDDDDDDEHHHHHDSNNFSFRSEPQQQGGNKVCLSSEGIEPVSSKAQRL